MSILGIIGIIFLMYATYNAIMTVIIYTICRELTTGTLVATKEQWDYEKAVRSKCYSPVYSYYVDDKEYTYSPKKYKKDPQVYEIGSTVNIKYCRTNPTVCLINNKSDKIGLVIICLIIGISLCFFAIK